MNTNREEMLDRMIAVYGLEHPVTIQFAHLCETLEVNGWNDYLLEVLVKAHEESPNYEED